VRREIRKEKLGIRKQRTRIKYKTGFRHQLWKDTETQTEVYPNADIITRYVELYKNGWLIVKFGYPWDGPSGPCRLIADRLPKWFQKKYLKRILRGSLFHDALSELMRRGFLSEIWLAQTDKELKRICLEDKMYRIRAWWVYKAVQMAGGSYTSPKNKRKILTAP